jgi:hypothetical protein
VGLLSTIFTLGMAIAGVPTGLLLARMSRLMLQLSCGLFAGFVEYSAKIISHDQVLSILERHGNNL